VQVGVIGLGRVGRSVVELLEPHGRIIGWDVTDRTAYPEADLSVCDFAVVCVGTPSLADGRADTSAVRAALEALPVDRVLLKSTVPPGTTDQLAAELGKKLCFWPEYVGESRYYNPFFPDKIEEVPFVILGGSPDIRQIFLDELLPILGPTKRYFQCTAVEAELAKYAENTYFATKIAFVNEFRRICTTFDADWHTVREAWLLDPRIEPMHTAAFAATPGFDGKCLPKDLQAIIAATEGRGYDATLLKAVAASNVRAKTSGRTPSEERVSRSEQGTPRLPPPTG
jgi:UDPglucose 6-dehydrogenase